MRISTRPSDPGYRPDLKPDQVKIYFNGYLVEAPVQTADEEYGDLYTQSFDEYGNPQFDESGFPLLEWRIGKVKIEIDD